MGLDLFPAGRAKPGHEREWQQRIQRLYAGEKETEADAEKRFAVSIQPWEDLGAPRVGESPEADAWALKEPDRDKTKSDAEVLTELKGFHAIALLRGKCDGLPAYTHAGLYAGLDETSFRGSFLQMCEDILDEEVLVTAWTDCMPPGEAITYGMELLHAADRAERAGPAAARRAFKTKKRKAKSTTGDGDQEEDVSFQEKIEILRSAGRWYVFWGKRGHPIQAWY
jgi:hypothetical protein